jgi:murein L,D-transpeptidase YcbB/YkuD
MRQQVVCASGRVAVSCRLIWATAAAWIAAVLVATVWCVPAHATPDGGISRELRSLLDAGQAPDIAPPDFVLLRRLYALRRYRAAWPEDAAVVATAALEHADADGLDPVDYHTRQPLLYAIGDRPLEAAERDLLLSDGVLRYARDIRTGRPVVRAMESDVALPEPHFDAAIALDAALRQGKIGRFLAALPPPAPEYAQLKTALRRYRDIAQAGGWPTLPISPTANSADMNMSLLRQRLAFEDGATDASEGGLSNAIKRFQLRHGLDPDGFAGPRTIEALNVSAADRANQILANMERWRWMPRQLEAVRVVVNVPDGRLAVLANGRIVLASRVIAGSPGSPTPILRALATAVTVNPPWDVPQDIANAEILPKLHEQHDYLLSQGMILRDAPNGDRYGLAIDWDQAQTLAYHVRQLPGPQNALGQVKLELPNRFAVFLHDTPSKAGFNLSGRDFSHGCAEVEQILPLASYALAGDPERMVAQLVRAIDSGVTRRFRLSRPLPVYLVYWTAFADADGEIEFRPDVYGRDERLIAALGGRAASQRLSANPPPQCRRA